MEKVHSKIVFVVVLRETWKELVQSGGASEDWVEVWFVGLVVGVNYVWRFIVVVIYMGFEGVKRCGNL